jgi:PPK2 family polyphosphate:nucleotide phosphotransferase
MRNSRPLHETRQVSRPYRITNGSRFRLRDYDPGDTGKLTAEDKPRAVEALRTGIDVLAEMQDRLHAQDRNAVLIVIQAMDAAGKDSAIKHVMSGVNPQGVEVTAFKQPTSEELEHDFLWRCAKRLPERGHIGIFNRSYYEEVLVVRVHPEILSSQRLPDEPSGKKLWQQRYRDIRSFERHLVNNGTIVRKIFLNVSRDEQKKRFLQRLDDPEKNWKFSAADVAERQCWKQYMEAYEHAIRETATTHAPWYAVPADNKWFTRIVVASAIIDALASLELEYPRVTGQKLKDFATARRALLAEGKSPRRP